MSTDNTQMKGGAQISYKIAFGTVIPLCRLSVLLAGLIISVANDMYAFVKPDRQITVSITEAVNDKDFSYILQQNGVISNAAVFRLYLRSKGKAETISSLRGEWMLNSSMSYREILLEIF